MPSYLLETPRVLGVRVVGDEVRAGKTLLAFNQEALRYFVYLHVHAKGEPVRGALRIRVRVSKDSSFNAGVTRRQSHQYLRVERRVRKCVAQG